MALFAHLRVHTSYSLSQGAISLENAIDHAEQTESPAIAITDINNLFGVFAFSLACSKKGIQPIIGAHIDLAKEHVHDANHHLILLAQTERGYKNLSSVVTHHHMNGAVTPDILKRYAQDLICLSGGIHGPIGQALLQGDETLARKHLQSLTKIFQEKFYLEIMRHGLKEEAETEAGFLTLAKESGVPIVATNMCFFPNKDMLNAHTALLCINAGAYVNTDNHPRSHPLFYLRTPQEMKLAFADISEAIDNTSVIAQRCSFYLTPQKPILPPFPKKGDLTENALVQKKAFEGLKIRQKSGEILTDIPMSTYEDRLKFELSVITKMNFSGYFLIMSDIIQWAKKNDIPVGPGRGSAAGSLVAWALFITNVDSLRFDLPFERFLNPDRISMPDFDIDFCQDRREEVINYVRLLYGNNCVAQIITFGTLQARGVLRDVGRVYQLPYPLVDRLCRRIPNAPGQQVSLTEAVKADPVLQDTYDTQSEVKTVIDIAAQLEGLHRHASTHAAGMIICGEPVENFVPLYKDHHSGQPVTQYTMKYVEPAGLIKFDFLGLKTLSVLHTTSKLIKESLQKTIEVDTLPYNDQKTFELLGKGLGHGVFQMESPGMRDLLRKSKPQVFEDMIAIVALYRPGPMEHIPTYIARKSGAESVAYLHPLLEGILQETYGIPVYQEQVMKTAQVLADYTMGEADLLRRAMGKKIPEEMAAQKKRFLDGAKAKDVETHIAEKIFDQMSRFAGYAFNKCHATCYALIAYQTAYMKANYLPYFTAASLSYELHTDKFWDYKQSLEENGLELLPVNINTSNVYFSVQKNTHGVHCVRYALSAIKGIGVGVAQIIVEERKKGIFRHPSECFQRLLLANVGKRTVEKLIQSGALDELESNRALLEELFRDINKIMDNVQTINDNQPTFFTESFARINDRRENLPRVVDIPFTLKAEQESITTGLPLRYHPLQPYMGLIYRMGWKSIADMHELSHQKTASILAVIRAVSFKKTQDGRVMTALNIFDKKHTALLMVFQEHSEKAREFLSPGKVVVLRVEARIFEDKKRFNVQNIENASNFFQDVVKKHIYVHVDASFHAKEFIDAVKKCHVNSGPHTLTVDILGATTLCLKNYFLFSEMTLKRIAEIQGVIKISA